MTSGVELRDVTEGDLAVFFEQQLDPGANYMAGFTAKDPTDRDAFDAKWKKILADETLTVKAILVEGAVAGSIGCHGWFGKPEVYYYIAREYWGRGVATKALAELLRIVKTRPLYAHAAKDNLASLRVLEKCGFAVIGQKKSFANARDEEIEELVLELKGPVAVTLDRVADLSDADHEEVRVLRHAVYTPEDFATWPGRHVEWSTPEWCVRVRGDDGALVSYVGVYVREAECDGRPVRAGGIGNVKTHPAARERGFAGLGLRRAVKFLRDQPDLAFALLVCEPHLIGYYARLGWREFGGRLLVRQRGALAEFTLSRVMTIGICSAAPTAGTIDLCGPPW